MQHLRSALATSLSLHGKSSVNAFPLIVFIGLLLTRFDMMPPRVADILRGRGGTAGLPLLIWWWFDWASSELESSWPAFDRLTAISIQINWLLIKCLVWCETQIAEIKMVGDVSWCEKKWIEKSDNFALGNFDWSKMGNPQINKIKTKKKNNINKWENKC